jgi:hypothetical protein
MHPHLLDTPKGLLTWKSRIEDTHIFFFTFSDLIFGFHFFFMAFFGCTNLWTWVALTYVSSFYADKYFVVPIPFNRQDLASHCNFSHHDSKQFSVGYCAQQCILFAD